MSVFDTSGRPKLAYTPQTRAFIKGATFASQIALAAGVADAFVTCPVAGQIVGVQVFTTGGTGSCVIDVRKVPFSSFPPGSGNSIVASAPPTISSGTDYTDDVLSGWTTQINAGDVLGFHLTSSSVFTSITVQLTVLQ